MILEANISFCNMQGFHFVFFRVKIIVYLVEWGVKLVARGLDASRISHALPGSAKTKNFTMHHDTSCHAIKFDTHVVD